MQQFFGVCLDDVGAAVSVKHAAALVSQLPRESRVLRVAMTSEQREAAEWTLEVRLLAVCANALRGIVWQNGGGKRADKPKPILPPEQRRKRSSGGLAMPGDVLVRKLDAIHEAARREREGK